MRGRLSALAWTLFVLSLPPGAALASERPIPHPEAAQIQAYSIFRTAPERLPSTAPKQEIDGNPGLHLNNALAQRVAPPGGPPVWLVPGRGVMRIMVPLRPTRFWGVSFTSTSYAVEHGLKMEIYEPELPPRSPLPHPRRHHRAIGLVPDGVVAVELEDGVVARVENNVYSKRVAHRETSKPVFIWGEPMAASTAQAE
jgi:hypothetical protein